MSIYRGTGSFKPLFLFLEKVLTNYDDCDIIPSLTVNSAKTPNKCDSYAIYWVFVNIRILRTEFLILTVLKFFSYCSCL